MKLRLLALVGILILVLAGCGSKSEGDASGADTPEGDNGGSQLEEESSTPPRPPEVKTFTATQENVTLSVDFNDVKYTQDSIISTTCTILNDSNQVIAFNKGSGSNIKPDGLLYELSSFVGLFYPEVVTDDYQLALLNPGESISYAFDFVPYTSNDGTKAFGTDKDLDYFKGENFSPVQPGVYTGTAILQFAFYPEGADPQTAEMPNMDDPVTIALNIETEIV